MSDDHSADALAEYEACVSNLVEKARETLEHESERLIAVIVACTGLDRDDVQGVVVNGMGRVAAQILGNTREVADASFGLLRSYQARVEAEATPDTIPEDWTL